MIGVLTGGPLLANRMSSRVDGRICGGKRFHQAKNLKREKYMSTIGRRELLMLLVHFGDPEGSHGLGGITRIQKLLFLLDREENIRPGADGFKFEAYKAGPYSPRVYDDLEFLENREYISRFFPAKEIAQKHELGVDGPTLAELEIVDDPEASDAEKEDIDITFEELLGPEDLMAPEPDEVKPTADAYEEIRYYLTEKGKEKIEALLGARGKPPA